MDLKGLQWHGFGRKNGLMGIRNKVLVIYTVECSSFVAKEITRISDHMDVDCIGFSGCTDNEYAVRMLISLIRHPNVGAVLAVGLGCEYIQPEWLSQIASEENKLSEWMFIQTEGGTKKSIEKGVTIVRDLLEALKATPRVPMTLSDLIIGAECGGSDYTSGIAGNVVVGRFFDLLIDHGGTAIFEEIVEAIGLIDLFTSRAASDKARDELQYTYDKALEYCKSVRQYSVSPGNFAGGLSTIEEKSMGAVVKSGTKAIEGVLKIAKRPPHQGLWLLDSTPDSHWMQFGITNPNDNEGLMDLVSSGSHIVLLVTGRGTVVGSAVSPCVKITGNSVTFSHMEDDMDFNAGLVLSGDLTLEESAQSLIALIAQVASGTQTKSEVLGHKEYFIPYKYQDNEVISTKKCES